MTMPSLKTRQIYSIIRSKSLLPESPQFYVDLLVWFLLLTPIALAAGATCAFFMLALEHSIHFRFSHGWIIYLLPLAGMLVALLNTGVNRLSNQTEHLKGTLLHRLITVFNTLIKIPLAFFSAVMSNLFGASVGREGTALQMSANFADGLSHLFDLHAHKRKILIFAGVAAGFGAIFGTPVAGMLFVVEVTAFAGTLSYRSLLPCVYTAMISDTACGVITDFLHIKRLNQVIAAQPLFAGNWHFNGQNPLLLAKIFLAAVLFGIIGRIYMTGLSVSRDVFAKICKPAYLRPALGGILTLLLVLLCGSRDYLGLGVISSHPPAGASVIDFFAGANNGFDWAWKLIFTLICIGSGFRGGNVTPMFFIGAGLGCVLGPWIAPEAAPLFTGIGFVCVFCAALKTPITATIIAAEVFGTENLAYYAFACVIAFAVSGSVDRRPEWLEQMLQDHTGL
ncbi:voltage-gated chloride channel protein [Acetobacteraceae bacterium]|nr:voltage-gated chloride channel protein [Acetobacteraceae bacterium]